MIDTGRNQARARRRALALNLWETADQVSATEYLVNCTSARHPGHLVTHAGADRWVCDNTCEAGQRGLACAHVAAAWMAWSRWETPKPARLSDSAILGARARGPRCERDDLDEGADIYAALQPVGVR